MGWWGDKNHREGGEEGEKEKVKRKKMKGGCSRKRVVEELVAMGACGADPNVYKKKTNNGHNPKRRCIIYINYTLIHVN